MHDHDVGGSVSHLGLYDGTVSQVQDRGVAVFLDGDDLGRVPDGALGQLVLERLQQEVPLHAPDFVWPADLTKEIDKGCSDVCSSDHAETDWSSLKKETDCI